ncbi:MAG: sensor histidine kinase [Bacteroidia bacterium]|nr:sensor histidine kinase [Bacteroidia bacterium]
MLDSIYTLRELSNQDKLKIEQRLQYAKQASELSADTGLDSTILISRKNLSYNILLSGDYDQYAEMNIGNLVLAQKIQDTLAIADANFNLGWYNQYNSDLENAYQYYLQALKYYEFANNDYQRAITITNIASIQDEEKDYLGSEQNAIEALRILNNIIDKDVEIDIYYCLNLLGIVSYKLKNYDKAIEYHNESLDILKNYREYDVEKLYALNNIAIAHRDNGEYEMALKIFEDLFKEPNLRERDPSFYALLLANNAYTDFLNESYEVKPLETQFKEALRLSDSINDDATKLAVSIDLAKFYQKTDKLDSSLKYAKQSYTISKEITANELLLESMILMADLTEGEESKAFLAEHITLSDSLLNVERAKRNKFARIRFETDQLEEENKQFARDRQFLAIISIFLLIGAVLIYIVINQRAKNKELQLVQAQQKANEDIYNLLLQQQDKVDEARTQEKKRMSQELHDGVLGRLFGTRLSLDSLNFSDGPEAIKNRTGYIEQLKTIEEDIRKISHELNTDFVSGSGFMDIVTELVENQSKAYQLTCNFNYSDDISWENIDNKTKINIYRIIQESMQNIYKHAKATSIDISITLKNDVICLKIKDDGKGFDSTKSRKGIGIKNMTSRIKDIEGDINFISKKGKGTKVIVEIPYIINDNDRA